MTRWIGPAIAACATILFAALTLNATGWTVLWLGILTIGATAETVALIRRAPGDTFSETVWAHTRHPATKVLLGAGLLWLFAHLTFGL